MRGGIIAKTLQIISCPESNNKGTLQEQIPLNPLDKQGNSQCYQEKRHPVLY